MEHISEPYGSGGWTEGRPHRSGNWAARYRSLAMGALCMGIGAGLMYILSPAGNRESESSMERNAETTYYSGSRSVL